MQQPQQQEQERQLIGLPGSPSMYGRIRAWLLHGHGEIPPELIRGDLVNLKIENVRMLDRFNARNPSQGTLYLTTTHLIFVDHDAKKETWILHMHIASVEKLPLTTTGSRLLVRCKTFLSVMLVVPRERDCHDIYVTLQQLSQPASIEELYCFHYTSSTEDIPKQAGWNFFDLQSEYQRMGVPNDQWTLTTLNQEHELCDTYPRLLYVPSSATTTMLIGSSRFRSKGRLPVLAYLHRNKAVVARCSQPLSGFSARCLEDEQMLNCVLRTNPNSGFMYVVDTRPKINAMANRAAGKGYENEAFYENIKFQFLGVENIHVMRSSLSKLVETCELKNPTMSGFLSGLESSGWLRHIKSILDTSWFIAQALEDGVSVVVHCSDGWDRTAQVCSLAALLLDPHYRTVQGFQALVEKDWLAFGHKFSERCGHAAGEPKEVSPVFTQLLDATWQLTQQFPAAFQFNERFLLTLHDHVHSCQFGTFVGNCEKDRLDLRLADKTFSLWGYMANHMHEYMNPLYCGAGGAGGGGGAGTEPAALAPVLCAQNIRFWRGMYCRFEGGVHPREPLGDLLLATCDHTSSLEDHVKFLTKRITALKTMISAGADKRRAGRGGKARAAPAAAAAADHGHNAVNAVNALDNRYLYEKASMRELEAADDCHPLKAGGGGRPAPDAEPGDTAASPQGRALAAELESVALDWKTLRNVTECCCSTPFDHFSRKYHCWKCGDIFCMRCIDKHTKLPGHLSHKSVPVCRPCYQKINGASSESP